VLAGSADAREREREPEPPRHEEYQADALAPVPTRTPEEIELLRGPDAGAWPGALEAELERNVRADWPADRVYGTVFANLGVRLRWPLVTAQAGGRVIVPLVESAELPIAGELELAANDGPRRTVVLLDASASANSRTRFGTAQTSVLDAEWRALEHLLARSSGDWLELGVIAFGETTWPIAEPGASAAELHAALARFRGEHPEGEGRTDAVCALWLARDWLDATPDGVRREVVVLTDGDAPFSGRFAECDGRGRASSDEARAACEARRNLAPCPASHRFSRADGDSDAVQIASFARHVRGELVVHPLVFEADRSARMWRPLASQTNGRLVRVPGPEAIELALPSLVASRVERVVARNVTRGSESGDLLAPDRSRFAGALALVPGANDVELSVESDRGTAALFRFRVYSAPNALERFLADLRQQNRELALRAQTLDQAARDALAASRARSLEVEAAPANAAILEP
jgi:hypothetical protein